MEHAAFDELAGRIEGLGRTLMIAITMLEDSGRINGAALSISMRQWQPGPEPHLHVAQRTLTELAEQLDEARAWRQSRAQ